MGYLEDVLETGEATTGAGSIGASQNGDSLGQGFGGEDGGAQSATRQYSKLRSAPSRGGCRSPARSAACGAAVTDPVPRPRICGGALPRDGYGYRPVQRLPPLQALGTRR